MHMFRLEPAQLRGTQAGVQRDDQQRAVAEAAVL